MPRFSEKEKEIIREKLLSEGAKLFLKYGLQKVTIDDLVDSVKIAKASFYKFYEGKEYLYLDILQSEQKQLFDKLDSVLENNKDLSDRIRVKQVFGKMYELLCEFPLLTTVDKDTIDIISRKISEERLAVFSMQGFQAVDAMQKHGIKFAYDVPTVSTAFSALYHSWVGMQNVEQKVQAEVIGIMLEGLVNQVVVEDKG